MKRTYLLRLEHFQVMHINLRLNLHHLDLTILFTLGHWLGHDGHFWIAVHWLPWLLGISSGSSSCRWASDDFVEEDDFCKSEVQNLFPNEIPQSHFMSLTPIIWCMNFSVWASREASWKWKAIKHTGWTTSLYWALLKCNSSRRRETKGPQLPTTKPSLLHSQKETTLVAEQIQSKERNGLLGTDTFIVIWEERKLEKKRKTKNRKHQGITDGVWR